MMVQQQWWKTNDHHDPHYECLLCGHNCDDHDDYKSFLLLAGRIIGRKRVRTCRQCACHTTTYVELIERQAESTFWDFVSQQPEFQGYAKVNVTPPEIEALKQIS